jgi:hypothetical protein
MNGKKLVLIVSLALMASACVAPAPPTTLTPQQQGVTDTKKLLLLMDKDQNGKVSRAEFMSFMSSEFDQLDTNHDGQLDVKELTALQFGRVGGTDR